MSPFQPKILISIVRVKRIAEGFTGVVVDVNDAHAGSGAQAGLNKGVVGGKVRSIKGTAEVVVDPINGSVLAHSSVDRMKRTSTASQPEGGRR